MKTNNRSRKSAAIEKTRWAAYATAGAATALAGLHSAEAEIHYSGLVNAKFAGNTTETFEVVPGEILEFRHNIHYYGTSTKTGGSAFFHIFGPGALVAGFYTCATPFDVASVSNLVRNDPVSERPFVPGGGVLATDEGLTCGGGLRGQFLSAGVGFIGFKFNTGRGDQYGWARVEMFGAGRNKFRLVDYAYGDPGDRLRVGQKSGGHAPSLESLGGLAMGAAGLLAWRKRRVANHTLEPD
jgi:hypothetical protein